MPRNPERIREDLAYAIGEGLEIMTYLQQQHRVARGEGRP